MLTLIDIHTHVRCEGDHICIFNLKDTDNIDFGFNSFGIHPWDIGKNTINTLLERLAILCEHNKIIALGEIGIDRAIDTPLDIQIDLFRIQYISAEKYKLPVIIHCVKAWSDLLGLRTSLKTALPWIFHGYNGNMQNATQLISKGCYLSFGEALLNNRKIQKVFTNLPLEAVFLETDTSKKKIELIYKKAADLRHICVDDLKVQLYKNFKKVFPKL